MRFRRTHAVLNSEGKLNILIRVYFAYNIFATRLGRKHIDSGHESPRPLVKLSEVNTVHDRILPYIYLPLFSELPSVTEGLEDVATMHAEKLRSGRDGFPSSGRGSTTCVRPEPAVDVFDAFIV